MFSAIQDDLNSQFNATFLGDCTTPILDLYGQERGITRALSESDGDYVTQIQNFYEQHRSYQSSIEAAVTAALGSADYQTSDNWNTAFMDGAMYCDDPMSRIIDSGKTTWFFNFVIAAFGTGTFSAGEQTILAAVVADIEENKASGTSYDILYLSSLDTDPNDGSGFSTLLTEGGATIETENGSPIVTEQKL
jgi:hypothetical protein